jgi:hypothetical protein
MVFPFRDGLFVSFHRTTFRLLTRPLQAGQQSPDMGTVKLDLELLLDDLSDARRGPKIGGVTPGQGTLQHQFGQLLQLAWPQLRRTPGGWFCFQAFLPALS